MRYQACAPQLASLTWVVLAGAVLAFIVGRIAIRHIAKETGIQLARLNKRTVQLNTGVKKWIILMIH